MKKALIGAGEPIYAQGYPDAVSGNDLVDIKHSSGDAPLWTAYKSMEHYIVDVEWEDTNAKRANKSKNKNKAHQESKKKVKSKRRTAH